MTRNDLPRSLIDNPQLDRWIQFEPDGGVRLGTGKVELGQGILTALRQMAAEELDVLPGRVRVVSGETGHSPEEGFTAGSQSVEASGWAIRLVCAEVRQIALDHAAEQIGCASSELFIEDGQILRSGRATALSYWTMAGEIDLQHHATGTVPVRSSCDLRVIGRSLQRTDLAAKLVGGAFIHDMRPEGLLHARILRRPRQGSRLVALDEAMIARIAAAPLQIVRVGDFVALVADDEAVAAQALEIAGRAATWTGGSAPEPSHAEAKFLQNLSSVDRVVTAPGYASSRAPSRTLEATYSRPYLAHASIGLCCALALWDGATLTVWSHSQGVGPLRASLARSLDLDPACVRVLHRQAAGCYGHNGADDVALDAALVAVRCPGRTVRVQWTREDELSAGPFGAAAVATLRAAVDDDGRPVSWEMEIWSPTHAQRPGMNGAVNLLAEEVLPTAQPAGETADVPDDAGGGGNRNAIALYDLPPQRVLHHLIRKAPLRTSALRGLGAHANVFAIESFVDELAAAASRCPVEYRLAMISDPRARRVIESAATMSPWTARGVGGDGKGLGLAFSRYKNKAAYLAAVAEVEVDMEVHVRRIWCAVDAGLVINPDGALNQVEGGAVQATSWTVKEQVRVDNSGIMSRSWDSYPIQKFSEVPEVLTNFVGSPADPSLGVGEVALGPVTAAIANAVAHALGHRVRHLPLSRERVMAALLQEGADT